MVKDVHRRLIDLATLATSLSAIIVAVLFIHDRISTPNLDGEDREIEDWRQYAVGHWLGPSDAPIVIVEWGDYQCPACRHFHRIAKPVLAKYPDEVALVYRHWPLSTHQFAYHAARGAECAAAQGASAGFHQRLMEVDAWMGDAFERFALEAGVNDMPAFRDCVAETGTVPRIEADVAAVQELGGRGTPTILINGILLGSNPLSSQDLDELVAEQR